mmetsp:Transcript_26031/g.76310  ORF Transcript_26031/g.76310 Transcript_26031/m.76310 type:complete len:303 (+) Transcript_26031:1098-2006(+)
MLVPRLLAPCGRRAGRGDALPECPVRQPEAGQETLRERRRGGRARVCEGERQGGYGRGLAQARPADEHDPGSGVERGVQLEALVHKGRDRIEPHFLDRFRHDVGEWYGPRRVFAARRRLGLLATMAIVIAMVFVRAPAAYLASLEVRSLPPATEAAPTLQTATILARVEHALARLHQRFRRLAGPRFCLRHRWKCGRWHLAGAAIFESGVRRRRPLRPGRVPWLITCRRNEIRWLGPHAAHDAEKDLLVVAGEGRHVRLAHRALHKRLLRLRGVQLAEPPRGVHHCAQGPEAKIVVGHGREH